MSKFFKTGLFGFNKEDVMNFVSEAKSREAENMKQISSLNEQISDLRVKLAEAEATVADYKARESAITSLSASIGKLYLVAQANAEAVVAAVKENTALSEKAVADNFAVADSAEAEIEEISIMLEQKTADYLKEVAKLRETVAEIKSKIAENNSAISAGNAELESITSGVKQ